MKNRSRSATTLLLFCTALAAGLAGCTLTTDVAKYRNDICELHGLKMDAREMVGIPGSSRSQMNFSAARDAQFPHYDGVRWSGDYEFYHASRIRDFVCPKCNEAFKLWRAEHPEIKLEPPSPASK